MAKRTTKNLIIVSDLHAGCRLGLCPPDPVRLDDGGTYHSSKFQRKVWGFWEEFWMEWVPSVIRGEPYDVIVNGDVIDGTHHHGTTQISHNIEDQLTIAEMALKPQIKRCRASGGKYYHIRGTEAHVGQSAVYEEMLAKRLGAIPNDEGQHARYDIWKRVGPALVHCLHHVGTTGSAAHEASAVNAELTAEYVEAARWHRQPPDYCVRSHRHRFIAVDVGSANGYAAAIVTPAWQGKSPFAWKIPGARLSEPQFGGILIRAGNEEHYYRRFVKSVERSKTEED